MSEKFVAQKREGSNDTVHLYDGQVSEGYRGKEKPVLCAGPPLNQPSKSSSMREYDIGEDEIREKDYLERDGKIIGKICGNCAKIATGRLFE